MKGYIGNIEEVAKENNNFRRTLYTGKHSQLVAMNLKPGEEIGAEVHPDTDQFFRIDAGEGKVVINGIDNAVKDGFAVVVPAGANHNVINTSPDKDLKLYTIYSPPHHRDGVVHATKAEATADDENFDGKTSE
ncbi:cupin [Candidatus Jorgensenbacteria bacterium RIFCSPLOWO2_12_FULL_42_11]|uniref:Cupin n=1 Tax=Candidatus Jorgensenbacteria bacterium RIFCSPLOWO2_12_FULL_42_11 TaxID=1798473 RepID=A0A1F6C3N3_9BACT|nr:MAG: cupin [Candidatus Jorgensenbacteria bacterium RIFCSPLOWO2_12_FULL_42_11]